MVFASLTRLIALVRRGIEAVRRRGPDRAFLLAVRFASWKLRFQYWVSDLPPRVNSVVTSVTITWVRGTVRFLRLVAPDKYTDADPYAIRYVDPDRITYISGYHDRKRRGWVVDGDWNEPSKRFMEQPIPKAIRQRYEEEMEWNETALAAEYDDQLRFERKCEKIERLHDRIITDGYLTQRNLFAADPDAACAGVNATMSPVTNEITVDIGRDGEILWNMLGKHRLSIAKVTGVDVVPVLVFVRHREWQYVRDRCRDGAGVPGQYVDHPDIDR